MTDKQGDEKGKCYLIDVADKHLNKVNCEDDMFTKDREKRVRREG